MAGPRTIRYSTSPLLTSRTPVWRSKLVVAMVGAAFVVLAVRAAYIQVFSNNFFQKQGEVRYSRTLELPATRGRILDRNGQMLATSVLAPSIWAIPEDVEDQPQQWQKLARLLDMPLAEVKRKLQAEDKTFVWLKRQVDEPTARQVAALGIKGIYQTKEYKRQYPEGEAAAHLVGFTSIEDHGLEGVELAFNDTLAGKPGSRRVIKDRLGRVVEAVGTEVPPVEGRDVRLSIDSKIQFFAYERLRQAVQEQRAQSGSVVVLDAQSGEMLAMANYPSYTPDRLTRRGSAALRNSALTDAFEPGSTVKPFVAALALERGIVTPTTSMAISSNGQMRFAGAVISDTHTYPVLTVSEIVQKSSNIGIAKLALQMPASDLWELYSQIGFGQRPQLPFPGVVSGRLRPWKSWKPIEHVTMSYGYGLSVSLVQLAQAYTVFAHDGEIIPITLQKTQGEEAEEAQSARGVRLLQSEHARAVRQMLRMVTSAGGTATRAQAQGYSVGGKTGTARKLDDNGTYSNKKYRSVFVGLAPVEQPRIIVAVMIDEPGAGRIYGGDVAAPVFSDTVQQTLHLMGVQPDLDVKPQIVADGQGKTVKGGAL
ncbi:peptidoglycan D,D-transpeptidase FtsI family protein [Hylemonella gracilis]|uniref:Peptidoglycan D,D-transpeptidase FtsI n=1 Tax=Hylemonella gracilis ATCC 19624 TaxID=887062 RepID=F3KQ68_9BURK|nr:penicillin-binding protein 2 [Hylemonella gracilis]EGI78035.1 peptidoglycan synthetase FtsI [Hylemonella gracilis ATCC 19624]